MNSFTDFTQVNAEINRKMVPLALDLRLISAFTWVNAEINRKMVPLALDLLDISPEHTVLDLFCGLEFHHSRRQAGRQGGGCRGQPGHGGAWLRECSPQRPGEHLDVIHIFTDFKAKMNKI